MGTTIIILIIAYLIMSKVMGRNEDNLPRRPGRRPRGDIEHTASGDATFRNEDGPLSGPWDASSRSEDGPLPGPWNRLPRSDNVPLPGQWEREKTVELEEPVRNRRQQPAVAEAIKDTCIANDTVTSLPQKPPASRVWQRAGNPLAAALQSKRTIVGSMIIGDVLNSRGGRNRRHRGQFR